MVHADDHSWTRGVDYVHIRLRASSLILWIEHSRLCSCPSASSTFVFTNTITHQGRLTWADLAMINDGAAAWCVPYKRWLPIATVTSNCPLALRGDPDGPAPDHTDFTG